MSATTNDIQKAIECMDAALTQTTGLGERERQLVVYWSLATHSLAHVGTFPLLSLVGKMGTGKSQALKVIGGFAYRPRFLSLRSMTLPAIRDELSACYEGSAIIEEADKAWKDGGAAFEALLSDRYQRSTAEARLEEKHGDNWQPVAKKYFGASVLHRRIPFSDAALDGRSIPIHFRPNHNRTYSEYREDDPLIVEGSTLLRQWTFQPPAVEQLPKVAARIFNTYRPLIAAARFCGDKGFLELIQERLLLETAELKAAQSAEPDGLVLRAILDCVGDSPSFANVKISALSDSIFRNNKVTLQPRQIAGLARQLGFKTKESHGVTVVVPTPTTLLAACDECGYEDDEVIAELKTQVMGTSRG
jgi:hypothetical protein